MILKYLKPFGLVLLLFSFYTCKGQNNLSKEVLLAEASLLHLQKDYKNAILKLEKAFSIQKPDALNAYKAAGMYSLDENKTKAFQYLNLSLDKGWTEADQLLIHILISLEIIILKNGKSLCKKRI